MQAQGYKIIDSLETNEYGCLKTLFYFASVVRMIFTLLMQVEKEKKMGMVDINLRSIVDVTSLEGGLASLRNLCMHFDFPRPLTGHPYQSYLKYLEEKVISDCERSMLNAASNL